MHFGQLLPAKESHRFTAELFRRSPQRSRPRMIKPHRGFEVICRALLSQSRERPCLRGYWPPPLGAPAVPSTGVPEESAGPSLRAARSGSLRRPVDLRRRSRHRACERSDAKRPQRVSRCTPLRRALRWREAGRDPIPEWQRIERIERLRKAAHVRADWDCSDASFGGIAPGHHDLQGDELAVTGICALETVPPVSLRRKSLDDGRDGRPDWAF
jgi:hypothetical protein